MVRVFYSSDYVGAGYAFDTTRKSKWVAESLIDAPIAGLHVEPPQPLTREQVAEVHDPQYVRAVETGEPRRLAESQGFRWDAGLWPMVLASNGGVVAAVHAAMQEGVAGSLSSGLHHADYDRGAGFCTFNGLAIAAKAALANGAKSVLILDLDAHCGGGTAGLIAAEPRIRQIDVSVSGYDNYDSNQQSQLQLVDDSSEYIDAIWRMLAGLEQENVAFDLCLYNAGMDPCEDCSTGGMAGITLEMLAFREQLVFEWCASQGIPIAFVLAGGYVGRHLDQAGLVDLHRTTLDAAAQFLSYC